VGEDGGVRIHDTHPFATPDERRDPVRRLRGRLTAPVTLWTAGTGAARAGLTVASTLVADGEPGRLLGLVDEESDLFEALRAGGRFAVQLLDARHRQLADRFGGVLPAPGGPFATGAWRDTPYGPVLDEVGTWAGCRVDADREIGWSRLVEATIDEIHLGGDAPPLLYHRGRYRGLEV